MVRSSSLPDGPNPFWSSRSRNEWELLRARPSDLPTETPENFPVPETGSDWGGSHGPSPMPLRSMEVRVGRARSRSAVERDTVAQGHEARRSSGDRSSAGAFRTPPSSWVAREKPNLVESGERAEADREALGRKTEGAMPPFSAEQRSEGEFIGNGTPVGSSLEKSIGEELVRQLMEQNQLLQDEVKGLSARVDGSTTGSWSAVSDGLWGGEGQPSPLPPPPPRSPRVRKGSSSLVRRTPGGTEVPAGPPPDDQQPEVSIPSFPSVQSSDLSYYVTVDEEYKHGRMGDLRYQVLESQVNQLQEALKEYAVKSKLQSEYWSRPVQKEPGPKEHLSWLASHGHEVNRVAEFGILDQEVRHSDRASIGRDGILGDSRALANGGHVCHSDRAGVGRDRVSGDSRALAAGGQVCQGDRAGSGRDGVFGDIRAPAIGDEVCQGDRAGSGRDGVCGDGRAAAGGGDLCQGDQLWMKEKEDFSGDGSHGVNRGRGREEDGWEEQLKSIPVVLPTLPVPNGQDASLAAGDWIVQIRPLLGDLAPQALQWWDSLMEENMKQYKRWLCAGPLERLGIGPPELTKYCQGRPRLEMRITSLLLAALPKSLKEELIASRQLNVGAVMYKVLKTFQPGGLAERSNTLNALVNVEAAGTAGQAVERLRLWKRRQLRAQELQATLPDPSIMIRALTQIIENLLPSAPQAQFRIQAFRMQSRLDVQPTEENLESYYQFLLAEAETLAHNPEGVTGEKNNPQIKAMTTGGGNAGSWKGDRSAVPCKWWGHEEGCRAGKQCRFSHEAVLPDKTSRCWLCSSKSHRKNACPTRAQEDSQSKTSTVRGENGEAMKGNGKKGSGKGKNGKSTSGSSSTAATTSSSSTTKAEEGEKSVTGEENKPAVKASSAVDVVKENETGNGAEELLTEVTSLLKSLRLQPPQLRAYQLMKMKGEGSKSTLLDGGATRCLRRKGDEKEWQESLSVKVQLASGEVSMRMHPRTKTLLANQDVQEIVPVSKITELGYEVKWMKSGCQVHGPHGEKLNIVMEQGCPTVDEEMGRKLMRQIEDLESSRAALRAVIVGRQEPTNEMEKLARKAKEVFPNVPDH